MAAKLFFGGCCAVQWWAAILLGSILSATDPVRPSPQAACLLTTSLGSRLIDTWGERTKSTMTLVHGDFRAENIFFDDKGQVAAMVDFQVCKEGTAVGDVACVHCQQSLPLVGQPNERP